MSRWLAQTDERLQAQTELGNLALFVSLFCAVLFLQTLIHFPEQLEFLVRRAMFEAHLDLTPSYLRQTPLLGLGGVPEIGQLGFVLAGVVLGVSLLGAAVGIRTRLLLVVALVTFFLYFGQILELGYVRRKTNLIPFVLLIFVATPDLRRCRPSVWLAALRCRQAAAQLTPAWPLTLIKFLLAWTYFSSSLSKIRNTGWSWASGDVLQASLVERYLADDVSLALWLAGEPGLCQLASILTLVFEFGFFTVLLLPRYGPLYALAGVGFHTGIQLFMGIHYLSYWGLIYLVFVDLAVIRWCAGKLDVIRRPIEIPRR